MQNVTEELIREYLGRAYRVASSSPDPSNQNGALLVRPTGHGYECSYEAANEFPPKVLVTPELLADRDKKIFFIEHAERHVIYKAARDGAHLPLFTLVCPWVACDSCSRAIILSGIKKVITHRERADTTPERWKASVDAGIKLMRDHGVELEFYSGKLNNCPKIVVNGELWQP